MSVAGPAGQDRVGHGLAHGDERVHLARDQRQRPLNAGQHPEIVGIVVVVGNRVVERGAQLVEVLNNEGADPLDLVRGGSEPAGRSGWRRRRSALSS